MNITINLAERDSAINQLTIFRDKEYVPFYVRISNSHIKSLNKVIGRVIFKKDAVYINSQTLHEIMQPVGGKGKHNYHGLTHENVYNALIRMRYSQNIITTFDDRYVVITDVVVVDDVKLLIIVSSDTTIVSESLDSVITIITIYPSDKDKKRV